MTTAKTVTVYVCSDCERAGRSKREVFHLPWCHREYVFDPNTRDLTKRVRSFREEKLPQVLCAHGNDVTLSPHECQDCSQAIGERNANCQ